MLSLSTVHVPFDDMLTSAAGLLLERIAGHRGGDRTVTHPITPVPRSTLTRA